MPQDAPDWLTTVTPPDYSTSTGSIAASSSGTVNVGVDLNVRALVVALASAQPLEVFVTVAGHSSGNTYFKLQQVTVSEFVVLVDPNQDTSIDVEVVNAGLASVLVMGRPLADATAGSQQIAQLMPVTGQPQAIGYSNQAVGTVTPVSWTSTRAPTIFALSLSVALRPLGTSGSVSVYVVVGSGVAFESFNLAGGVATNSVPLRIEQIIPGGFTPSGWTAGGSSSIQIVTATLTGTPTLDIYGSIHTAL